jgi:hypothetical protein
MALLAYLHARMVHVEATGSAISTTSNAKSHYAKIAAAVFLALAVLTLLTQLIIFS